MKEQRTRASLKTSAVLSLIILGACLLIFRNYIRGNETFVFDDIGSDTMQQYVMQYNTIVNHLREGTFSFWDFNYGFGASMFGLNLTDPFLMVLYGMGWLFGADRIPGFLIYIHIFKIVLAGLACYFYLSSFRFSERSKFLGAICYAFNGFLIVWGQHYLFGTIAVMLPILYLCVELTIRKKRNGIWLALASGITVFTSLYLSYMALLATGMYLCVRSLMSEQSMVKEKVKSFFAACGSMILGVSMGAVSLLPMAAMIFGNTTRLSSSEGVLTRLWNNLCLWPQKYYETTLFRFFSSNLEGGASGSYTGFSNYYEDIQLFFSTLFIILAVQYVCTIHKQSTGRRQKSIQYASLILLGVIFGIQTGSVVFNGFAYAFSRHSFILMPLFGVVVSGMLHQIMEEKKLNKPALFISLVSILVIYGLSWQGLELGSYKINALILCGTGTLMVLVIWGFVQKKWKISGRILYLLLVGLVFVNIYSDTALNYKERTTLKKDDIGYFGGLYYSAANKLLDTVEAEDKDFYRVEKDFTVGTGWMDSLAMRYRGISTYNSMQNGNITQFVSQVWPNIYNYMDGNHYSYSNGVQDEVLSALCGIKYILSKSDGLEGYGYTKMKQVGDTILYKNEKGSSIGKFFTKAMTEEEYLTASQLDWEGLLTEVVILNQETEYTLKKGITEAYVKNQVENLIEYDRIDKGINPIEGEDVLASEHYLVLPVDETQIGNYARAKVEFTLQFDKPSFVKVFVNDDAPYSIYMGTEARPIQINLPKDAREIKLEIRESQVNSRVSEVAFYGYQEEAAFSNAGKVEITEPERDSRLTGTVSCEEDGIVMLAIPYEKGWSYYLDGKKQDIYRADMGFTAFEVKAGSYQLEAVYEAPLLKGSILISICGLVIFAGLIVVILKINKKEVSA